MTRGRSATFDLEKLALLQRCIESLYRLDPAPHIGNFLLPESAEVSTRLKEVLYLVEDEELHVGLKLAAEAIAVLGDPHLDHSNLATFCLAVEGVSHYLCVMHRAREDHPTSALELELQAEVDKFIAALLLARRCPHLCSETLRPLLYRRYFFVNGLTSAEEERYQRANDLAARYTDTLEKRFIRPRRMTGMVRELRHFYRASLHAKEELIRKAA